LLRQAHLQVALNRSGSSGIELFFGFAGGEPRFQSPLLLGGRETKKNVRSAGGYVTFCEGVLHLAACSAPDTPQAFLLSRAHDSFPGNRAEQVCLHLAAPVDHDASGFVDPGGLRGVGYMADG
jgi:hypothetical protein